MAGQKTEMIDSKVRHYGRTFEEVTCEIVGRAW
jgi:hypothetical protein